MYANRLEGLCNHCAGPQLRFLIWQVEGEPEFPCAADLGCFEHHCPNTYFLRFFSHVYFSSLPLISYLGLFLLLSFISFCHKLAVLICSALVLYQVSCLKFSFNQIAACHLYFLHTHLFLIMLEFEKRRGQKRTNYLFCTIV